MHDSVVQELNEVEKERKKLIGKLPLVTKKFPFFLRYKRRFATGDGAIGWNLSSLFSWATAFPSGLTAGLAWSAFSAKVTSVAAKVWGGITLAFTATLDIVT